MDMILLPLIDVTSPSLSLTKSFPIHSSLSLLLLSSLLAHATPDPASAALLHALLSLPPSLSVHGMERQAGR
jgi:hypothetical protein